MKKNAIIIVLIVIIVIASGAAYYLYNLYLKEADGWKVSLDKSYNRTKEVVQQNEKLKEDYVELKLKHEIDSIDFEDQRIKHQQEIQIHEEKHAGLVEEIERYKQETKYLGAQIVELENMARTNTGDDAQAIAERERLLAEKDRLIAERDKLNELIVMKQEENLGLKMEIEAMKATAINTLRSSMHLHEK